MANGVLTKRGSFDLLQQDVKNRIRGLFSDAVSKSWKMLSEDLLFHMPTDQSVADFFVLTKTRIDDHQKHTLSELFGEYIQPPYGMNQYSLSILIIAFLSFYESFLMVFNGAERINIPQLVQTVFTPNKLQFTTLLRLSITAVSETSLEAIHRLCSIIKANRYVEKCQELSNNLEQMLQASGISPSAEADIASARMRVKEGIKFNKQVYDNLNEAQTNEKTLQSKFSFIKAIQVFVRLEKTTGEIEEGSDYYYSEDYTKAAALCIQQTEALLVEMGMDSVEKIRFDITQLSQAKSTYKKVIDTLNSRGFCELAKAIQDHLASFERSLVSAHKYKQSIDDLGYFFSTTKINTNSDRAQCQKAAEAINTWIQFLQAADDFPAEKRNEYLNKLENLLAACNKRIEDIEEYFKGLQDAIIHAKSESDLAQVQKMIIRLESFGTSEQQEEYVNDVKEMIRVYLQFWDSKSISRENFSEIETEISTVFSNEPFYSLATNRLEKINQEILREAKAWMQKNVFVYTRRIHNMPVVDAIRLQATLERVPNCLDATDIETVQEYRNLVAERIKFARVEAIELMFKELDIEEKNRCLDDLKRIMDRGLKQGLTGKGYLKNPRFTDEELILLLYCYIKFKDKWFSACSLHVLELSRLYRDLPIHSAEERLSPNFRNPAGIDLQIRTMAQCDSANSHKQKLTPSLDMIRTWEEYSKDQETLQRKVMEMLSKYSINPKEYQIFDVV